MKKIDGNIEFSLKSKTSFCLLVLSSTQQLHAFIISAQIFRRAQDRFATEFRSKIVFISSYCIECPTEHSFCCSLCFPLLPCVYFRCILAPVNFCHPSFDDTLKHGIFGCVSNLSFYEAFERTLSSLSIEPLTLYDKQT